MEEKSSSLVITHFLRVGFKTILITSVFLLIFSGNLSRVWAATYFFSPSSGSYQTGQTFSVSLYVSSPDQAENATQGTITFPTDKLQVIAVSKGGSINTLWIEEPRFNNSNGTIKFAGIVPNPGFTGSNGKVISATFRVDATGEGRLTITKGSILANDGQGTQILESASDAVFALLPKTTGPVAQESTIPSLLIGTPFAPQISSPTNPDPDKWYNNPNPIFTWQVPSDITAVKLSYSANYNSYPIVVYTPPISQKEIENVSDGIYYFSARLKNKKGWGAISRFRFQIDTQPPKQFQINFINGRETDNPRPEISFKTTDSLSGMDYYKLKIGEGDSFVVPASEVTDQPYTLPLQEPGRKTIIIQAFDKAGNYVVASDEFTIKPIAAPTITDYSKELQEGDSLVIKGETYPKAVVTIHLQRDDNTKIDTQEIRSDNNGEFTLIWQKQLASDVYKFWAEVTDPRGAKSGSTDKFVFSVKTGALFRIGFVVINYATIGITLIVIIIALAFLGWNLWHKFRRYQNKLRKETNEASRALHLSFDILRENLIHHIKLLERKKSEQPLTKEENQIIAKCKSDLTAAEELIAKEIKDIEKEIK